MRDLCDGELAHTPSAARYQIASFVEDAPEPNEPPAPAWQNRAHDLIAETQRHLWSCEPDASEVRRWLDRQRGLSRSLLKLWQIGWLPHPVREPAEWWDLPADDEAV